MQKLAVIVVLAIVVYSCAKDFLETQPYGSVNNELLSTSEKGANALLIAAYSGLMVSLVGITVHLGVALLQTGHSAVSQVVMHIKGQKLVTSQILRRLSVTVLMQTIHIWKESGEITTMVFLVVIKRFLLSLNLKEFQLLKKQLAWQKLNS